LEIGQLIAGHLGLSDAKMEPASLREYRGAPRSPDTSLNCAKIQKLLSFRIPGLSEWLQQHPYSNSRAAWSSDASNAASSRSDKMGSS